MALHECGSRGWSVQRPCQRRGLAKPPRTCDVSPAALRSANAGHRQSPLRPTHPQPHGTMDADSS
ncbi:hypothetical protein IAQ61_007211 [Plenodomus lingam]|uniref:uncharacterized protein n=1 Tax=Leptosphaeria maculans TaxID=5022 RepID=UPI00332572EC|nr:hypothetical protein IAQ61_007211 [Plenodomus lingam]